MDSYVYLLKAYDQCEGLYKIGKANNPKKRVKQFSVMPFRIELLHTIKCTDPHLVESRLHDTFRRQRTRGEWFRLADHDVNIILGYKDQSDVFPRENNRPSSSGTVKTIIDWLKIEQQMTREGIEPATKRRLAELTGLTESTVSNVTSGRAGWRSDSLEKIAICIGADDPLKLLTVHED